MCGFYLDSSTPWTADAWRLYSTFNDTGCGIFIVSNKEIKKYEANKDILQSTFGTILLFVRIFRRKRLPIRFTTEIFCLYETGNRHSLVAPMNSKLLKAYSHGNRVILNNFKALPDRTECSPSLLSSWKFYSIYRLRHFRNSSVSMLCLQLIMCTNRLNRRQRIELINTCKMGIFIFSCFGHFGLHWGPAQTSITFNLSAG